MFGLFRKTAPVKIDDPFEFENSHEPPGHNCPVCKHGISKHGWGGCQGRDRSESQRTDGVWYYAYARCRCTLTPPDVKLNLRKQKEALRGTV